MNPYMFIFEVIAFCMVYYYGCYLFNISGKGPNFQNGKVCAAN